MSLWSLNFTELNLLSINTSQLAITCQLFPHLINSRVLTRDHIAAIEENINRHFPHLPSSSVVINGTSVANEISILIKQAAAYGQYRNSLRGVQFGQANARDHFNHFVDVTSGMNRFQFLDCVENWFFLERLQFEGEPAQKEVLEAGWRAFAQVPQQLKLDFGLLEG